MVPLLVVVLLTKFEGKEFVGLGLFLLAALTDFLDGFIARRRQLVTRLGKLLDPAADKILTSAAFISLVEMNPEVTPAWMVVVIGNFVGTNATATAALGNAMTSAMGHAATIVEIAREFAVSSLRGFAASESVVLAASPAGKLKTTLQIAAISLLIFYNQLGQFERPAPICLWLAMLVSLYSGAEYFVRNRPVLQRRGGKGAG